MASLLPPKGAHRLKPPPTSWCLTKNNLKSSLLQLRQLDENCFVLSYQPTIVSRAYWRILLTQQHPCNPENGIELMFSRWLRLAVNPEVKLSETLCLVEKNVHGICVQNKNNEM